SKKKLKKGLFVTFEGPEGSGKTTHCRAIYGWLRNRGYDCVLVREPGGTAIGEKMRDLLLDRRNKGISPRVELFLFETSRCQLVQEIIVPALKKKKIVLCDRFTDSTVAYQGYAGNMPIDDVTRMNDIATGGLKPDVTILLDIDPAAGMERRAKEQKRDRIELKSMRFHHMVRRGYLEQARRDKRRIRVVRASGEIEMTYKLVEMEIKDSLKAYGG
ncbi:MAG: dTMP kinase, partial [Candidatus Omnitrophica bacterium]|nr:dTMP kinase [Candidatus Omnitrophota bacterium]